MITTLGYTPASTSLSDFLVVSVCPSFTSVPQLQNSIPLRNVQMKKKLLSLDELYCVLQFCDYKTLCSCMRTCSSWLQVYKKNEQQLYFSLYKSYFTPIHTEMGTQKDWKQMFVERMKLEMKVSKVPKLRHSVIEKSTAQNLKIDENQSVVSMVDRISQLLSCYREEVMNEESVQLILGEVVQQSFLLRQYHMFRENMQSLILKFPQLKYLRDNLRYQVYKTYDEQLMIYVKLSVELLEVEATMCSKFDETDIFVQFIECEGEKNTLLLLEDGKPKWDDTSLCVLKKRFKMEKMKNEEVKKVLGICLLPFPYSDTVFQYYGNTPFLVRFIQELRNEYFV